MIQFIIKINLYNNLSYNSFNNDHKVQVKKMYLIMI